MLHGGRATHGFYLQDTDCGDVKLQWLFGYPSSAFGVQVFSQIFGFLPPTNRTLSKDGSEDVSD